TGRVNWFIRALAVWGGVMLLVPIRVYEAAAVFAVASPLIVALVGVVNWLENRPKPRSTVLPMGGSELWGTWQRLLSLLRLARTSLRLATVSLHDQPGSCNTPGKEPPAIARLRFGLRDLFFLMLLVAF